MNKSIDLIISAVELVFGTALTAAAFGLVIIPQHFVAGGVTGLCVILAKFIPLPLSYIVMAANILVLLIGLIFIGKKFVAKTIAVSLLFPFMLEACNYISLQELSKDPLVSAIVAGVMLGSGAGLVLRSGASSGGFDVIGVALNKKFRIPVAVVMNICDLSIILFQVLTLPLLMTVYGILVICVYTRITNYLVNFGTGQSRIMIFSRHYEEISEKLLHEMVVGMTYFDGETGYDRAPIKVIVSVVPYDKVIPIKKLITSIDPLAFVVIDEIHSVLGRGYTLDRYAPATEILNSSK